MPKLGENLYSVENLNDMRLFINKKSRPTLSLTDKIWQLLFEQIKGKTIPLVNGEKRRMKIPQIRSLNNPWGFFEEDQSSDYKRYCFFINDTLRDLRKGKKAICYYEYQIVELLKFHKETLRTKYDSQNKQWEVWLDNGEKNLE